MPEPSRQTKRAVAIVGTIISACAILGAYFYLSQPASVANRPRTRKRVVIASQSPEEIQTFLTESSEVADEIYCTVLVDTHSSQAEQITALKRQGTHVIPHEKSEGLIHITRHISPDLIIVLPTISDNFQTAQIYQWVGQAAILVDDGSRKPSTLRNVRYYDATTRYEEILAAA